MSRGNILAILYVIMLFLFLAAAMATISFLLKKKKKCLAILLIIFTIAVELTLFNLSLYPKVTLPRANIIFEEKPTSYSLPNRRILSIISEDVFNNFRPALYKKHTVSSSYTISQEYLDNNAIAEAYILVQDFSRKDRIYEMLDELNIRQFIYYGLSNFDNFSIEEKRFFTRILQATIEGFMLQKDFYQGYININEVTGNLIKNTTDYRWFSADVQQQARRISMQESLNLVFSPSLNHLYNYNNAPYLILNIKEKDAKPQDFLDFIYNNISTRQYLLFLFEKRISDEHAFVVLRNYYELVNANAKYKKFRGYNTLLSDNLLKIFGVTAPIIRYYSSAEFSAKRDILSNLSDLKSKKDVLYIEAVGNNTKSLGNPAGGSKFSYKILNYNPDILELQYTSASAGYLYFSDCYDTYWNAYIDGKKTIIYKANVAFKAIQITAGVHKVKFIYDPEYFRYSLWVYYIIFGMCGIYLTIGALLNIKKS